MTGADAPIITGSIATLRKGDPVLVLEGPMAGLTGEFFQYRGTGRVIVKIEIMGRYAGVEIEREKVEPAPNFFS